VRNQDHWYLSPLREEKTPSFKVDRRINVWYDHGTGKGGDLIDFGTLFYRCTVEQDRKLFYKVVFGRWLILLAIMLFITNLYKWGVHWSDNQKMIQLEQIGNDRMLRAWGYLYDWKAKPEND
jgi:hypothetical protein